MLNENTSKEVAQDFDAMSMNRPGYEKQVYKNPKLDHQMIDRNLLNEYQESTETFPELYVPPARRNRIVATKLYENIKFGGGSISDAWY